MLHSNYHKICLVNESIQTSDKFALVPQVCTLRHTLSNVEALFSYLATVQAEHALRRSKVEANTTAYKSALYHTLNRSRVEPEHVYTHSYPKEAETLRSNNEGSSLNNFDEDRYATQMDQQKEKAQRIKAEATKAMELVEEWANSRRLQLEAEISQELNVRKQQQVEAYLKAEHLIEEKRRQIAESKIEATARAAVAREKQALLARSRIEAEITSQILARNEALRRSRIDAAIALEMAVREKTIEDYRVELEIAKQKAALGESLKRSRIEAELRTERQQRENALAQARYNSNIEKERALREEALRRSRVEEEMAASRSQRQQALKRSRIQAERAIREDALRRSRIEAQIQASRQTRETLLRRSRNQYRGDVNNSLRRTQIEAQLQASRNKTRGY